MLSRQLTLAAITCLLLAFSSSANAKIVEYDLTIRLDTVNRTGEDVEAITINGGIPGPTLRFQDGDSAIIRVHNQLRHETSIHWHGILVPPGRDGVPCVSFPPIAPETTFT